MIFDWFGRRRKKSVSSPTGSARTDRIYRPGQVIAGEWRILRVVEGGLGVVYVVEHRETGVQRALKGPKSQLNQAVQADFRVEAEAWVRLGRHPNIVAAYGIEELAGQLLVLAELVRPDDQGRVSLRDYLIKGALAPRAIAGLTADFCYGLSHGNSKGLHAHRDIKPENFLIGERAILRITDFGLAHAMAFSGASINAKPTRLGAWESNVGKIAGTPPYMAPEQWLGRSQNVRTDLYAFGIILFEMSYGKMPFRGPTIGQFQQQHLAAEPVIPSGLFSPLIERCLAKDPLGRFADPNELLVSLGKICDAIGIPLPPRPSPRGQEAAELEALVSGLRALGKNDEALTALTKLLKMEPQEAGHWTDLSRMLLERGDAKGAMEAIRKSLSIDPTRSPAWNNFGILLKGQTRWEDAIRAFERAIDCNPLNTAPMLNSSQAFLAMNKPSEAIKQLLGALELAPDKYQIWFNLSQAHFFVGDKKKALEYLQQARALAPSDAHELIDVATENARALPDR